MVFFAALFFAAGFAAVLRTAFFAVVFLAAVFFVAVFLAATRPVATERLAVEAARVVFLAAVFLAAVFFAGAFLAVFFTAALVALRLPVTSSLKPVPGRKAGTTVFLTFTASPVRGLRAMRAARWRFSKTPKPAKETFSPFTTARCISSIATSTTSFAAARSPVRAAIRSTNSALFTSPTLPISSGAIPAC